MSRGAMLNGQLLPISQNQAIFALLGTTYGGEGVTNFALPTANNLHGDPRSFGAVHRLTRHLPIAKLSVYADDDGRRASADSQPHRHPQPLKRVFHLGTASR
jgi:Phage Tail Collar Domain